MSLAASRCQNILSTFPFSRRHRTYHSGSRGACLTARADGKLGRRARRSWIASECVISALPARTVRTDPPAPGTYSARRDTGRRCTPSSIAAPDNLHNTSACKSAYRPVSSSFPLFLPHFAPIHCHFRPFEVYSKSIPPGITHHIRPASSARTPIGLS